MASENTGNFDKAFVPSPPPPIDRANTASASPPATAGGIATAGHNSPGLVAHSIAGGGGDSGLVVNASGVSLGTVNVGVGASGSNGGSSSKVLATSNGAISTQGTYSAGIDTRSIASSGGTSRAVVDAAGPRTASGPSLSAAEAARRRSPASSAPGRRTRWSAAPAAPVRVAWVVVNADGPISVAGAYAHGIFAQSASGTKTPNFFSVEVTVSDAVSATGANGRGILVQNAAGSGLSAGQIEVVVASGGSITTGTRRAETIAYKDSNDTNLLLNGGAITQQNAASYAVRSDGEAKLTITNKDGGIIHGAIDTPAGGAGIRFANRRGAIFEMGRTVGLGTGGALANDGTVSPLEIGRIGTAIVTAGRYHQTPGAATVLDYGLDDHSSDRIAINGGAVAHDGVLRPVPVKGLAKSGDTGHLAVIEAAADSADFRGLEVESTAAVTYALDRNAPTVVP